MSDAKLKLFSTPNWREKLASLLFPKAQKSEIADGIAEGREIHNFICCELGKIRQTARRFRALDKPAVLIVEPWMKDSIAKIFDFPDKEIIEIDDDSLQILSESID